MYQNGEGGERDLEKAREWYNKAAKQGYPTAQYNLALMYKNGQGGEQDFVKARQWYTKAAVQGDS